MTDYNEMVPDTKPIYSFKEIAKMGLITEGLLSKLFRTGKITVIKLGNRNNVARSEIIRYLKDNTIKKSQTA